MRRGEWLVVVALAGAGCASREQEDKASAGPTALVDGGAPRTARPQEPFGFVTDRQAATARARREGRPVFLYVCADWANECKMFDKDFASPAFVRAASRFVGVKVDFTDHDRPGVDLAQKELSVLGVPTIILLDANGVETFRATQYEPVETWVARLEQMR